MRAAFIVFLVLVGLIILGPMAFAKKVHCGARVLEPQGNTLEERLQWARDNGSDDLDEIESYYSNYGRDGLEDALDAWFNDNYGGDSDDAAKALKHLLKGIVDRDDDIDDVAEDIEEFL